MAKNTQVTPSTVRTWASSDEGQAAIAAFNGTDEGRKSPAPLHVGDRGRLHPVHRALYSEAHPGETYTVGLHKGEARNRTFTHKALDKRGRNRTAKTTMTLDEARALIGDTGKGRLNTAAVVAALEVKAGVKPVEASTDKVETSVEKS